MPATTFHMLANIINPEGLIPLALGVIAVFFLMSSLRRRQSRRQRPDIEEGSASRDLRTQTAGQLRREVDRAVVELQELSREIAAEIDTRYVKLEMAIRDADRRIATLHRLSRDTGAPPETSPETPPADDTGGEEIDNRHLVIYEMADSGLSHVDIARELGRTPGEVELILNLRRNAGSRS